MEERKNEELEETEAVPVDSKKETIRFPWAIAIVMGVLMLCIIACFIVIMVLGPENSPAAHSSISSSAV